MKAKFKVSDLSTAVRQALEVYIAHGWWFWPFAGAYYLVNPASLAPLSQCIRSIGGYTVTPYWRWFFTPVEEIRLALNLRTAQLLLYCLVI